MQQSSDGIQEKIAKFKESIAPDLYSPRDIVDFDQADTVVGGYHLEITVLQDLISSGTFNAISLSTAVLQHPRLYAFICTLLSIAGSIELEDGRILPSPIFPPKTPETAKSASEIIFELGVERLLSPPLNLRSLFLVLQIGDDAPRRRLRVDAKIKSRVLRSIESALVEFNKERGASLTLVSPSSLPSTTRRIVEYVIACDGIARIGVAATFQAYTGGRQTRDLTAIFPNVRTTLTANRIAFILIADGQGLRATPDKVLAELFSSVPHTMSLHQAEANGLHNAITQILTAPEELPVDLAGLGKLIQDSLMQGTAITATSLPVASEPARLSLANFASANNDLDLVISSDAQSLTWRRSDLVNQFRNLRMKFDGASAVAGFSKLVDGSLLSDKIPLATFNTSLVSIAEDPVFTETFLVAAREEKLTPQCFRNIARHALQSAPSSRLAVVVTATPIPLSELPELRDIQTSLPVTVLVIDISACLTMAQQREATRDRLRAIMLEQTDLTKLSPFVVRGVTPSRVFFGREEEEANLLSTLATNSVALLGGRRIGKTSLMRHSTRRLQSADLRPFFGDCQVVRTWADFGVMAARNWGTLVSEDFRPHHLFDLVAQLNDGSGRPIVILLDEIDQLLDWDRNHTEDQVPEAFFRACRSISQQGLAQFVFSGERTIANSLWDAKSPHWNFCKPLMLRQLTRTAANSLLAEPLEILGIRIEDRENFLNACWESTDGHPELLQFIGDKIVAAVNQRSRDDVFASADDLIGITSQFEYAEQYLETYWGQADPLERIVSILLIKKLQTIDGLLAELGNLGVHTDGKPLHEALRMLELYGIAEQSSLGYKLRANWFTTALSYYGGPDLAINRYVGEFKK
ncbi:AAA family ATPase [Massilia sp. RP-1-19]|uniref:AAA family ATPase n=1 Tax=Massilia polaris TaxID=2728846 RepID=A0A848HPZ2_9BURK|nr:ATP-binding protein [Massilia polaris]NML60658.1 AAA family ATPase [Massilia polaris]